MVRVNRNNKESIVNKLKVITMNLIDERVKNYTYDKIIKEISNTGKKLTDERNFKEKSWQK